MGSSYCYPSVWARVCLSVRANKNWWKILIKNWYEWKCRDELWKWLVSDDIWPSLWPWAPKFRAALSSVLSGIRIQFSRICIVIILCIVRCSNALNFPATLPDLNQSEHSCTVLAFNCKWTAWKFVMTCSTSLQMRTHTTSAYCVQ